jgi:phenylacetate-CoA ligase
MHMPIDYLQSPIREKAYSNSSYAFFDADVSNLFANITGIDFIENGNSAARESWQRRQLTNLLRHAHARSGFWRKRLPTRFIGHEAFKFVPALARFELASQVQTEGSLVQPGPAGWVQINRTTGSTGQPLEIYTSAESAFYNNIRSLAQYFFNNLTLNENRVQIKPARQAAKLLKSEQSTRRSEHWAGPLSKVYLNGSNKEITYANDTDALIRELRKDNIGYLVSPSRYVEMLFDDGGEDLIKSLGIKRWLHVSDYRNPEIVKALERLGIPCFSNYSSDEVGPIAFECQHHPNVYHVAHTNVIVEEDESLQVDFNGVKLSRLLITHLHSYASPIIRYDIGDFGSLTDGCACGHSGPTIRNIYGRGKHFLRHPNGTVVPFYLSTRALLEVSNFKECRIRQTEINTIVVELGGREELNERESDKIKDLVFSITDRVFKIEIKTTMKIDWSDSPKRLFFSSLVV